MKDRILKILKKLQWAESDVVEYYCPICNASPYASGEENTEVNHFDNCELNFLIKELEKELENNINLK